MSERPILFCGEMVRAILAGRKTQTRRPVKGAPTNPEAYLLGLYKPTATWGIHADIDKDGGVWRGHCPFGQPNDRLWVKETIVREVSSTEEPWAISLYAADGTITPADAWPWAREVLSSIHCPRGLSRILLEIVSVRVERLQDISDADAAAECFESRDAFLSAFRAMYKLGLNDNPWLWVVEFKMLEDRTK